MKKILVTGATGFIGSHVIQKLLELDGQQIRIIASSADETKVKKFDWIDKVQYIPFDLRKIDSSENYFNFFLQPDAMIHLAWEGLPNYKDEFHLHDNLSRHFTFLKNMIENGLNDLTVSGTCLEYGMQEGELNENIEAKPSVPYAIAKNELRKSIEELRQRNDLVFKWVRLFYTYGRGQNPKSLFSQLDKAIAEKESSFDMSGGEQVRDYLPIEKLSEIIVKIAMQKQVTGIINCCSGKPVTVRQMVEEYLKKKNASIKLNLGYYPYPDYEPMKFWGSTKKLNTILNNE